MKGYFTKSRAEIKKTLSATDDFQLIGEDETVLVYMTECVKDEKGMYSSDKLMVISYTKDRCYQVALVLPKNMMNDFIKIFNEKFVNTGKYSWADYGGETQWKLIRLEGRTETLAGNKISYDNYFTIAATILE